MINKLEIMKLYLLMEIAASVKYLLFEDIIILVIIYGEPYSTYLKIACTTLHCQKL